MAPHAIAANRLSPAVNDRVVASIRISCMRGSVAGPNAMRRRTAPAASSRPECAAGHRQEHALGEEKSRDAEARRPERAAHGHFALAGFRSHQEQVGDVGTRDQQHDADRRQQNPQRPRHAADGGVLECSAGEHQLGFDIAERRRVARKRGGHPRNESSELGAYSVEPDAVAQPRDAGIGPQAEPHRPVEGLGDPRLDGGFRKREPRRHDADDLRRYPVERELAADDPGIRAVPTRPQVVREDRRRCGARCAFRLGEPASDGRRDSEHRRERCGDARQADPLRLAFAGDRAAVRPVERSAGDRARSFQ
jgi:hypothetical protein